MCCLAEKEGDGREMNEISHFFFYIDFGRDVNGIINGFTKCRSLIHYHIGVYIHDPYKLKNGPGPSSFPYYL